MPAAVDNRRSTGSILPPPGRRPPLPRFVLPLLPPPSPACQPAPSVPPCSALAAPILLGTCQPASPVPSCLLWQAPHRLNHPVLPAEHSTGSAGTGSGAQRTVALGLHTACDHQALLASVALIQHRRDADQRKTQRTSPTATFFGTDARRRTAMLCLKRSDGMRAMDALPEGKGEDDEYHVQYLKSIGGEQE